MTDLLYKLNLLIKTFKGKSVKSSEVLKGTKHSEFYINLNMLYNRLQVKREHRLIIGNSLNLECDEYLRAALPLQNARGTSFNVLDKPAFKSVLKEHIKIIDRLYNRERSKVDISYIVKFFNEL